MKVIMLTTFTKAPFQLTGRGLKPNGREAIFICSKLLLILQFIINYKSNYITKARVEVLVFSS